MKLDELAEFLDQLIVAISDVVQLDITILDRDLNRVVGTGIYKLDATINRDRNEKIKDLGTFSSEVIQSRRMIVNMNVSEKYPHIKYEKAVMLIPINYDDELIGVIGFVAFSDEQCAYMESNIRNLQSFMEKLTSLIVTKLREHEISDENAIITDQLSLLFDMTNGGLMLIDSDYSVKQINERALNYLGISRARIIGNKIADEQLFKAVQKAFEMNKEYDEKFRSVSSECELYISVKPILHGEKKVAMITLMEASFINEIASKINDENFGRNYMEKECLRRVCICDHEQPVGIVMKHNLDATMSGKYGYAVFSNRPIERIMNRKPLVVDYYTPINVVAKLAMGRCDDEIFDDVVVTQSSQFFGLVSMKNIFEYTLMYEKNSAKEQNPLTGLPGNTIINRVLTDLVSSESQACVMYVDINEFKIYNDVYGFEKGDVMIKSLAEMIKSEAGQVFPQTAFVGHIGGDDFLVVCSGSEVSYEMLANRIINRFSGERSAFFSSEHNAHHQIVSEDRYGITRTFSLTSLSISGIFGDLSSYKSSDRLSEALAKLKKIVKKKGESASIFINCTPSTEEMI